MLLGHVPKEGEDHKAREETGQRVDGAGDDGISGSIKSNKMKKQQSRMRIQQFASQSSSAFTQSISA